MERLVTRQIRNRIRGKGRGWVFTAKQLGHLGARTAVDQALSRLTRSGYIRRLVRGIYEYPRIHPKYGVLSPNPESIASAVVASTNCSLVASGALAVNMLGLSTQVPAKHEFLTEGHSRSIKIGNQTIFLKHAAPSKRVGANSEAGLVIQALRSIGKGRIEPRMERSLAERLPKSVKAELRYLIPNAPVWTQPVLARIAKEA